MRLLNRAREISITWEDSPYAGKPMTRVWEGPSLEFDDVVTYRSGDTPEGRDREVRKLLSTPGWELLEK